MIERAEQDLRKEIIGMRDSTLNGRSLEPVANAMQVALNGVLNPPAPDAQRKEAPVAVSQPAEKLIMPAPLHTRKDRR